MKKLAIFDIDGTFYRWQLFHEVMIRLAQRGYFTPQLRAAIIAKYHAWQSRTEPYGHFSHASIAAFQQGIKAVKPSVLNQISREIIAETGHQVYSYTRNLQRQLKRDGYHTLALSGSMQEIVEPFAKSYGFDAAIGEIYQRQGDQYSGVVERVVVGRKAAIVREYCRLQGLTLDDSYAVGDSRNDIDTLELVSHPIAFNPDDMLLAAARQHGWPIIVERKNIVYTMEDSNGIRVLERTESL